MKLVHADSVIGDITSPSQDGLWMSGQLMLKPGVSNRYTEFFEYMTDEDQDDSDPPFEPELLDETSWFIVNDDGVERGIEVPAVHDNDFVMWRWR